MAYAKMCDRCGQYYKDVITIGCRVKVDYYEVTMFCKIQKTREYDLCQKCFEDLKKFMEEGADNENK